MDATGDGEWGIALRCGAFESDDCFGHAACSPAAGSSRAPIPSPRWPSPTPSSSPCATPSRPRPPRPPPSPPADDRGRPRPRRGPERLAPRRLRPGAPTGGRRGLRPRRRPDPLGPGQGSRGCCRHGAGDARSWRTRTSTSPPGTAANDAGRTLEEAEQAAVACAPALRATRSSPTATHFGASLVGEVPGQRRDPARAARRATCPFYALTNWSADTFHHAQARSSSSCSGSRISSCRAASRNGQARPPRSSSSRDRSR